jgi:hypothetical protein
VRLFLCWPEGVANKRAKVIGSVAEREERLVGITLPLAKVKLRKLRFFSNWNSEVEIVFLLEVSGRGAGEASLQHFLSGNKLAPWLVSRLKTPRRLQGRCFRHHHWEDGRIDPWARIASQGVGIGHIPKMRRPPPL